MVTSRTNKHDHDVHTSPMSLRFVVVLLGVFCLFIWFCFVFVLCVCGFWGFLGGGGGGGSNFRRASRASVAKIVYQFQIIKEERNKQSEIEEGKIIPTTCWIC